MKPRYFLLVLVFILGGEDHKVVRETVVISLIDTLWLRDTVFHYDQISVDIDNWTPPDLGKYKKFVYVPRTDEHSIQWRNTLSLVRDKQFGGQGMVQYIAKKQGFDFPASLLVVQSLIESNGGRSQLATKGNNYFGVKCFEKHDHKWCINLHDDHPDDQFKRFKTRYEGFAYQGVVLHRDRYKFFWPWVKPTKHKIRHRYFGKEPVFFPPYKWEGLVKDTPREYWIYPGDIRDLWYWEWICVYLDGQGYATSPFYARKMANAYRDLKAYNIDEIH